MIGHSKKPQNVAELDAESLLNIVVNFAGGKLRGRAAGADVEILHLSVFQICRRFCRITPNDQDSLAFVIREPRVKAEGVVGAETVSNEIRQMLIHFVVVLKSIGFQAERNAFVVYTDHQRPSMRVQECRERFQNSVLDFRIRVFRVEIHP
jgi:hypothetical protein